MYGLGIIKNIGFNLSNRYKFRYDHNTKRLTKEEYPNFLTDYFPKPINNFSAIVGANGTGKTTFIKFILQYFTEGMNTNEIPALVITKNGDKLLLSHPKVIEVCQQDKVDYMDASEIPPHPGLRNTTLIYLSNLFDPFLVEESDLSKQEFAGMYNLSTYYLLNSDSETYLNRSSASYTEHLNNHVLMELNRQVNFICEFYYSNLELTLPQYLILRTNDIAEIFLSKYSELNVVLSSWKSVANSLKAKGEHKDNFLFSLAVKGILNFIKDNFYSSGILPPSIIELKKIMIDLFVSNFVKRVDQDGVTSSYNAYLEKIKVNKDIISPSVLQELESLGWFLRLLSTNTKCNLSTNSTHAYFDFASLSKNERVEVIKIVRCYYSSIKITNYVDFIFSRENKQITTLSSGEYSLLALYSRIFWLKFRNGIELKHNLLFLIDEAELALHPKWQRSFIKIFVDFIETAYRDFNVQIILTSHSPFILSDMPPNNVIFLNQQENETITLDSLEKHTHTLAANIHELLSDSFFLDNVLIGDYSLDKIKAVIAMLQSDSTNGEQRHYIRNFIELLGEPFLKAKLQDLFNKKYLAGLQDAENIKH